jgi:DNA polymerase III epsilon subunit-like protein
MSKTRSPIPSMKHLNDDALAIIQIKTTGDDATKHDMIQLAIVVFDNYLDPHKEVSPFYLKLVPRFPEDADYNKNEMDDALRSGVDYYQSQGAFDLWFSSLGLNREKKLQVLGDDIAWQLTFIKEWLGSEAFNLYIDPRTRDLGAAARFLNDCACLSNRPYPVSKYMASYMASAFNIKNDSPGDTLHDVLMVGEVYKRLVGLRL